MKRLQMQRQGNGKPSYADLENRIAQLELAMVMKGKHLTIIQQPVGDQLVQAVNVHDVRQMNKQSFDEGFETSANISAVEYGHVFENHAKASHLLSLVVIVLVEIRSLAYHREAGMDGGFYRKRLKHLSKELSTRTTEWQNTVAEIDHEYSQRTNREIVHEVTPIMGIVSDAQDGIKAALRGNDSPLRAMFTNHSWHEDMAALLKTVNRGGAPAGERKYTGLLRWEVSEALKEDASRTPGQIANLIMHRYRTEKKECDAKGTPFSPLKEQLLTRLETVQRPGDTVKRVWPE